MEFTEEKAKEIADKYGIAPKTIKVWKSRGAIPDKYGQEGFTPSSANTKAEKLQIQRIRDIHKSEVFNMQVITDLCTVPYQKLMDAERGRGRISSEHLSSMVKEITKLKAFVRSKANAGDILSLYRCKALKFYVINGKDDWAKQMDYILKNNGTTQRNDLSRLLDNYRMAELTAVL